jgi:hypothetical protein
MKLRMLFIAAALLVCASLSFGQATFNLIWADGAGGQTWWYPLTYDCAGDGPVLEDGTVVQLWMDIDNSQFNPGVPTHSPPPIGADVQPTLGNGLGQINKTEFVFNSAVINRSTGSYYEQGFVYTGGVPGIGGVPGTQSHYLVIACPDGSGGYTPMYTSAPFNINTGFDEYTVRDQIAFPNLSAWHDCNPCAPPISCEGTSSPFDIQTTAGGHGAIPNPDVPEYYCVYLCPGFDLDIVIGPLWFDEEPQVDVTPGCLVPCDDPSCPPAAFDFDPAGWTWVPDPANPPTGYWTNRIFVIEEGCACICLEDILSAELLNFGATAYDAEVKLAWSTAAENSVSAFQVMRDGEVVHSVVADGAVSGASYEWMDADLTNGRTYSYKLVEVAVNGNLTIIAETEATPMTNLALVTEYALHQNYPNPFNPTTTITFDVLEENLVTLTIYNAVGQQVTTLTNNVYTNGRHTVEFSSDNLTSGLYFYTVKMGSEFTATKKMLLVK